MWQRARARAMCCVVANTDKNQFTRIMMTAEQRHHAGRASTPDIIALATTNSDNKGGHGTSIATAVHTR